MNIGLFFGSYNPVHVAHMIIANYALQFTDLEKVWLVLSPQNPFKKKESLAFDYDRLHLLHLATKDNNTILPCSVEFGFKKPSFTIDTLNYLGDKYPEHIFSLIMGGDNLQCLPRWKNADQIIEDYQIYVYMRQKYELGIWENHKNVLVLEAPILDISASFIRKMIKKGKSIQYMVPDAVYRYLSGSNMYKD